VLEVPTSCRSRKASFGLNAPVNNRHGSEGLAYGLRERMMVGGAAASVVVASKARWGFPLRWEAPRTLRAVEDVAVRSSLLR
jgi:hypothetical protein